MIFLQVKKLKSLGYRFSEFKNGFHKADVIILFNNHKNYKNYDINKLVKKSNKPLLFYDCWQMYNPREISKIPGKLFFCRLLMKYLINVANLFR